MDSSSSATAFGCGDFIFWRGDLCSSEGVKSVRGKSKTCFVTVTVMPEDIQDICTFSFYCFVTLTVSVWLVLIYSITHITLPSTGYIRLKTPRHSIYTLEVEDYTSTRPVKTPSRTRRERQSYGIDVKIHQAQ